MQKLIWTNANGDSVDLTSGHYGITNWEGFSNTPLNIQTQQVPFQDGGVFLDALMEQRELTVTLAMNDEGSLETRYRLRRELISILNPKLGEGYLIYKNDFTQKRIKCVPQIPLFETHNSDTVGTPKASLSWTACEPYWEDLEERYFNLNLGYENTLQYDGDVPTSVEAEIFISNTTQNVKLIDNENNKTEILDSFEKSIIKLNSEIGKKTITEEFITEKFFTILDKRDIVYGNGIYLTKVGNNQCFYSYNGIDFYYSNINWTRVRYIDEKKAFYCVSYNKVYKSVNGKDWNKIAEFTSSDKQYNFYDVCYSPDGLVIVGGDNIEGYDQNCCFVSTDEENWSEKNIPTSTYNNISVSRCIYIFWGNNKYYILTKTLQGTTYYNELITTSDLENWNVTLISGYGSGGNITSAVFYDKLYLSLNQTYLIEYDETENTFVEILSHDSGVYVMDIEIINYKIIALCKDDNSNIILYEITEDSYLFFYEIKSTSDGHSFIVYNNDDGKILIYVGNDIYVNYELSIHNENPSEGFIIYFPKTKEYFSWGGSKVYKSKDLYNWELIYETTIDGSRGIDFKYFEGFGAIVGLYSKPNLSNCLFYSYDGVNFTEVQYNLPFTRMWGVFINEFKGNVYIVVSDYTYGYSTIYKASNLDLTDIISVYSSSGSYEGGYFSDCAVSDNEMLYIERDRVVKTSDGLNFVVKTYNNIQLYTIVYGQNEFVILSSDKIVIKGVDFSNLELYRSDLEGVDDINVKGGVIYNKKQGLYYVLVSSNINYDTLYISANCTDWFSIDLETVFYDIKILNEKIVLTSYHGYAEIEKYLESTIINKLSPNSGLNISLFSGKNSLKLLSDFQGSAFCLIRYRQKYIGV